MGGGRYVLIDEKMAKIKSQNKIRRNVINNHRCPKNSQNDKFNLF
jgi:hypothetical protein